MVQCSRSDRLIQDSLLGGAGLGVSRSRRPLGSDLSFEPCDFPPPDSPAARYLSQLDLCNRYLAENETGDVYSDIGTAGTGGGTKISDDELGKAMAQDAKTWLASLLWARNALIFQISC